MASKKTTNTEKNNMATKKNDSKSAPAKNTAPALPAANAPAQADPLADLKKKIAGLPPRAQELILKNAGGTKLVKSEVGELRTFKLKTNGDPIKAHEGPKTRADVDHKSIANVVDIAGVEGLTKLYTKYGATLKKPLAKFVKGMPDGDDKTALATLAASWFPRKSGGNSFAAKDHQVVGKNLRISLSCDDIAKAQDNVKREIVTLADGRVGIFVWKSADAAPTTDAAPTNGTPAQAPAAQPAVPAFMAQTGAPSA